MITRRDWLGACAAGALASRAHGAGGALPAWAQRAIDEARTRIEKWKGGQDVSLFVTITDIHSRVPDVTDPIDWSDPKSHVLIAQEAVRQLGADALVDLGDADFQYVWDHPNVTPPADEADALIRRRIAAQFRLYREFERPVYFCRGNHDRGRTHREFSTDAFGLFNALAAAHGHVAVLGGEGNYGYFDVPGKNIRLFFLDSCEKVDYGFTSEQLAFVAKGLETLPDDGRAVVMQHYCIAESIGRWMRPGQPLTHAKRVRGFGGETLHAIFSAFVHSEAGTRDGVSWNFTGKPQRRLAACLCGDSHVDSHGVLDDVNYVVSQGYGPCHPLLLAPGATFVWKSDRTKHPMIDVLGVKRLYESIGLARVFRIGDGGAAHDREWCF